MKTMSNPLTEHLESQYTLYEPEMMNAAPCLRVGRILLSSAWRAASRSTHCFDASSEVDTGQGELFNIEEELVEAESTTEHSSETVVVPNAPLSKDLPRVMIRHDPE